MSSFIASVAVAVTPALCAALMQAAGPPQTPSAAPPAPSAAATASPAPAWPQWLLSQEGRRVVFRGYLTPASGAALAEALSNPEVEGLIISSGGGDDNAALDVAEVMMARRLPVTVRGQCASACANAIFVAGSTRTIERAGFLSLHHSSPTVEANYRAVNQPVPDDIARGAARMRALYARQGVDLALLDCAAAQVGLSTIQSQVQIPGETAPRPAWRARYALWIPHEATLYRFGVNFTRWGRPPGRRDILALLRPPDRRAIVFGRATDCA